MPLYGQTPFLGLADAPNSYTGQSLKGIRVNADENGLEFYTITDLNTNLANTNLTLTANREHALAGYTLGFTGGNIGFGIASPTAGIHVVAADDLAANYCAKIGGATTTAIYALNSGDVAIGTSIPTARLHIVSDNNNNGEYALKVKGLTTPGLGVYKNGKVSIGNADYFSGVGAANGMTYSTTNAEDYFVIAANGSYRHAFGWESGSGGSILMYPNSGSIATNVMNINHSYNTGDHITTGRNFGLGTRTPAYKLDVVGEINTDTAYRVGGTQGFTGTGAYINFTIVGGIITAAS